VKGSHFVVRQKEEEVFLQVENVPELSLIRKGEKGKQYCFYLE
jgi:hypothetical protein